MSGATVSRTVALIPAAGSGERLGYLNDEQSRVAKALVPCAGRPLLAWSLLAVADSEIDFAVVAAPTDAIDSVRDVVRDHCPSGLTVTVVEGGTNRSESVRLALAQAAMLGEFEFAAVHDAARPLVEPAAIDACIAKLAGDDELAGVILAASLVDTIKRVGRNGRIEATLDRSALWAAQTPQIFRTAVLSAAINVDAERLRSVTDDASLVEEVAGSVAVLDPGSLNIKVTTAADLLIAEQTLLARLKTPQMG